MLYIWFKLIIMKKIIFLPFFLLSITCFSQSYESKNDSINYIAKTLNFEKTIGITTINWNLELENGNLFINKSFFEKNKKGNLNLIKKETSVFQVSKINKIDIITNSNRNEIVIILNNNEYPYCFENTDKKEINKLINNTKIPRNMLILHCENPIRVEFKNYEKDLINELIKMMGK